MNLSPKLTPTQIKEAITKPLIEWYRMNAREIIWRNPATSAWGILLSEVMSQQTPVARVEPQWQAWMDTWPTPQALAQAPTAEVLRAWGKLGYPRRALRLKECAQVIVDKHAGEVPTDVAALLALPGIGDYTARAVAAFAYGQRVPVVDTNVRRVYARLINGELLADSPKKQDLKDVEELLPDDKNLAPEFSVALMELGALVCTTAPHCEQCPLAHWCNWQRLGCPEPHEAARAKAKNRVQKFEGTDRQVRGKIMAVLRDAAEPIPLENIDLIWPDKIQLSRALASLITDGLAVKDHQNRLHLPL